MKFVVTKGNLAPSCGDSKMKCMVSRSLCVRLLTSSVCYGIKTKVLQRNWMYCAELPRNTEVVSACLQETCRYCRKLRYWPLLYLLFAANTLSILKYPGIHMTTVCQFGARYIYIYTYIHIYIYTYMYIHIYIYMHAYVFVSVFRISEPQYSLECSRISRSTQSCD
jgi:hypothetical protein